MSSKNDEVRPDSLLIPDRPYEGPITYDAKDPDTSFPPIEQLRPPAEAPNVLAVLLDDAGIPSSAPFGDHRAPPTAHSPRRGGCLPPRRPRFRSPSSLTTSASPP